MQRTPHTSANRSILIVDDNEAIHADIGSILAPQSPAPQLFAEKSDNDNIVFNIDSAFSGKEGLQKIEQSLATNTPYALVFMDLRMPPGWDGLETLRRIFDRDSRIQAVICSAYSDYTTSDIYRKLGITDRILVLRKPFDNLEIQQMALTLTEKWNLMRDNLNHLSLVQSEIIRRKQIEDDLRTQQAQTQAMLDYSPTVIYIKRCNGEYLLINKQYETLFHLKNEDIIGKTDYDIFPHAHASRLRANDDEILQTLEHKEYEELIPHDDGDHTYISSKFPLYDATNTAYAICGISTDITDHKRMQTRLQQTEKMEAIGLLASGIAHDFNNILGGISGIAELLTFKLKGTPSLQKHANSILTASSRAATLTEQLLNFSRNNMSCQIPVDINTLTTETCDIVRHGCNEKIRFTTNMCDEPFIISGDPARLQQCILNILTNARDALPMGGDICITSHTTSNTGCLRIIDNGTGIDSTIIDKIFEPFFTTKGQSNGTGLGLAAVHGILTAHKAHLDIKSTPDSGSCFTITFPLDRQQKQTTTLPVAEVDTESSSLSITVIDDEKEILAVCREFLSSADYHSSCFSEGQNAIDHLKMNHYRCDAVLLDMLMPTISGQEVFTALRKLRPNIPIIIMTGYCHKSVLKPLLDQGPCIKIAKPFNRDVLLQAVETMLPVNKSVATTPMPI